MYMKRILLFLLVVFGGIFQLRGQEINRSVDKVYVVVKTHLDVGVIDLSYVVTKG